jgi:membrane-associated phospholipid phosphatase
VVHAEVTNGAGSLEAMRRWLIALTGAIACLVALVVTWVLAFTSAYARRQDAAALHGFTDLRRPRIDGVLKAIAHLGDPLPFAVLGLALVVVALGRGRVRTAVAVPGVLLAANLTTHLLKPALATPRFSEWLGNGQVTAQSWPSGHATASMSLALCAVLVAPARLRPLVATLGAGFAIAVSYALLTLGWHYPSDVLGGYLVAALWSLLAVAALLRAADRHPQPTAGADGGQPWRFALAPPALAAIALSALLLALFLARPHVVVSYARVHTAFVLVAAVLAAVGTALASGFVLTLRRGPERRAR